MKLFITDLKKIIKREAFVTNALMLLNAADNERFRSFSNEERSLQFLASRKIIKEHICPDYKTLKSGKVTVKNGFVSIAHSKNFVVVAFSENPVGVDIEELTERKNYQRIAERMHFKNCATSDDFFKEWTAFEADFKLGKTKEKPKHTYINYQGFLICLASMSSQNINIQEIVF